MEARRNGREARRNAWQVVTQNVYNGMFHQMGRYLTYGGTHKSTGEHQLHVSLVLSPFIFDQFLAFFSLQGSVLFSICFVNKNDFSILCTREKW